MKKILLALSLPMTLIACDSFDENSNRVVEPIDFSAYPSLDMLYNDKIKTLVETKCIRCHTSGKKAGHTSMLFIAGDNVNNLNALQNLINNKGGERLVNKATGRRHGGGTQVSAGSAEAQALGELSLRILNNAK